MPSARSLEIQMKRERREEADAYRGQIVATMMVLSKRLYYVRNGLFEMQKVGLTGKDRQTYIWYMREVSERLEHLAECRRLLKELDSVSPPLARSVFRLKKTVKGGKAVWSLDVRYYDERKVREPKVQED